MFWATKTESVVSKCYKENLDVYEKSEDNIKRSIATFYSSGVMGKRKYQSVRLALSMKSNNGKRTSMSPIPGCRVPKLLPYNKLVEEVNKIDIGKVYEIDGDFLNGLEVEATINGSYRDLKEYLPRLAKFYMRQDRNETLKWFSETEGTFLVALGGDGCPFGKLVSACSFLVSFLNVGRNVASSNDNSIVFGANCDETSPVVRKYVRFLLNQIVQLEETVFEFGHGLTITFKFKEFPNDMKMLAMLAGELPISAKYFSPFANVCKDDCTDLNGTFGVATTNKWQPWEYKERERVVELVSQFKQAISSKPISEKTKRSKVTDFIAKKKIRQEFMPLLGEAIERAHVEPLHLKNNAWQYFLKDFWKK